MKNQQSWSIIIFCYNEVVSVKIVFESVLATFKSMGVTDFEIIIVDDGSTDGSKTIISEIQKQNQAFTKAIIHDKNLGIGAALRSGYTNAKKENVCAIPADNQFDCNELLPLANIESETFVSFYRRDNLSYSLFRNILSVINKKVNSVFLGIHLKDVNWVKIYKTEEIKQFNWKINSSLIESELCSKLLLSGKTVREEISIYHARLGGKSKGASLKIIMQALKETFKLIVEIRKFKRDLKKNKTSSF